MCSPRTRDSVGHTEVWYRAPWNPIGLCLPCAWQITNVLSVYVCVWGHQKGYVVPLCPAGAQSFHTNSILLEGLALGANSPGALIIRVLGLNRQEKKKNNVGVSAHRAGLFSAQRLTISLNKMSSQGHPGNSVSIRANLGQDPHPQPQQMQDSLTLAFHTRGCVALALLPGS